MKRFRSLLTIAVSATILASCSTTAKMGKTAPDRQTHTDNETAVTVPGNSFETMIVDTAPIPPQGDMNGFRNWVTANLSYPNEAYQLNITGIVVVSFVVDTTGSIQDIEVLQTPHVSLAEEVCRVIGSSGKWQPATKDGQPANFMYVFPVIFQID